MRSLLLLVLISVLTTSLSAQQDSVHTKDSLSILADELTREYNSSGVNFGMNKADTPSFHLNLTPTSDHPVIFNQMNINDSPYNNTRYNPSNPMNAPDPLSAIIYGTANSLLRTKKSIK